MNRITLSNTGAQALPKFSINQIPDVFSDKRWEGLSGHLSPCQVTIVSAKARTGTDVCYIRGIEAAGRAGVRKRWEA
jgi:hypothetical protein